MWLLPDAEATESGEISVSAILAGTRAKTELTPIIPDTNYSPWLHKSAPLRRLGAIHQGVDRPRDLASLGNAEWTGGCIRLGFLSVGR